MGIQKIAKINSGSVKKSDNHYCHLVCLCGVGKPRLSVLITVFNMDSRDILVPIGFHLIDVMDSLVLVYKEKG
jgi:hypothetical protein